MKHDDYDGPNFCPQCGFGIRAIALAMLFVKGPQSNPEPKPLTPVAEVQRPSIVKNKKKIIWITKEHGKEMIELYNSRTMTSTEIGKKYSQEHGYNAGTVSSYIFKKLKASRDAVKETRRTA